MITPLTCEAERDALAVEVDYLKDTVSALRVQVLDLEAKIAAAQQALS